MDDVTFSYNGESAADQLENASTHVTVYSVQFVLSCGPLNCTPGAKCDACGCYILIGVHQVSTAVCVLTYRNYTRLFVLRGGSAVGR